MNARKARLSILSVIAIAATTVFFSSQPGVETSLLAQQAPKSFLGFDLNIFPGKTALPVLRRTFTFGGYWLSAPPGEKTNTWIGKRELVRAQGFGFLLLYRGRESRELR